MIVVAIVKIVRVLNVGAVEILIPNNFSRNSWSMHNYEIDSGVL